MDFKICFALLAVLCAVEGKFRDDMRAAINSLNACGDLGKESEACIRQVCVGAQGTAYEKKFKRFPSCKTHMKKKEANAAVKEYFKNCDDDELGCTASVCRNIHSKPLTGNKMGAKLARKKCDLVATMMVGFKDCNKGTEDESKKCRDDLCKKSNINLIVDADEMIKTKQACKFKKIFDKQVMENWPEALKTFMAECKDCKKNHKGNKKGFMTCKEAACNKMDAENTGAEWLDDAMDDHCQDPKEAKKKEEEAAMEAAFGSCKGEEEIENCWLELCRRAQVSPPNTKVVKLCENPKKIFLFFKEKKPEALKTFIAAKKACSYTFTNQNSEKKACEKKACDALKSDNADADWLDDASDKYCKEKGGKKKE